MADKLYAMRSPSGVLLWDTCSNSRTKAWDRVFWDHIKTSYSHAKHPTKAAYSRGWRCVPVRIVEVKNA